MKDNIHTDLRTGKSSQYREEDSENKIFVIKRVHY